MGVWLSKTLQPRLKDSYSTVCCVADLERKKQNQHYPGPKLIADLSALDLDEPDADPCKREGYLLTRDSLGAWRLRFFSLRASGLYICSSHSDEQPRGFIPVVHDPDRPPPEVSALPVIDERSFQIFFDCSWLLGAGSDDDRAVWLAAIATACAGPRPSNLEAVEAPAQQCAGPLTRHMMDGSDRTYWSVLLENGWMLFYSSRERAEAEEMPKIRLNLRSKHGVATARPLGDDRLPQGERSGARPEPVEGRFQLLCGLECFLCAESPDEMSSWIDAISDTFAEASARAAARSPAASSCNERVDGIASSPHSVGGGSVGSLESTYSFLPASCINRRSCPSWSKMQPTLAGGA